MSENLFSAMSNEVKQWYCIENVEGEMFSIQEIVDLLNELVTKCHKLEKEKKGLENEHERQNNEIKLLRQEHRRLRNQVKEWEKIYCYTKKFHSINDLDINLIKDNDYITPSVIEITFGEIINENKRLRKEFIEMKKELMYYKISNGYPNGNKEWEDLMELEENIMDRDKKRLLLCLENDFVWGVNDNHKKGIISYLNCLRR